jgi:hypothetical protein
MSTTRWQAIALALAAALVGLGVYLAGAGAHRPGLNVTLASATPAGSSILVRYRASLSSAERINRHDFFRIIDVRGYVDGSASAPDGWSVTAERISPAATGGPAVDDAPSVPNLVYTYTGSTPIAGPVTLAGFSARSTSGVPRAVRQFVGRSTRATGPGAGDPVVSAGDIRGPGVVPEPASLVSGIVGLILLGFVYACRHRRRLRAAF